MNVILSPEQLIVIGIVGSVVTQALRLLSERFGFVPSKLVINVVLLVLSFGLAFAFFGFSIDVPAGVDPVAFFVEKSVALAGAALLIYNVVLDKVLMPPASKLAAAIKYN
jgi:hypothetical protein